MFSAGLRANGARSATKEKQKRMVKSPYQLMALENFYNEHKYPSEEMKTEFAVEIGLSEKQVSGWFCHRRVKDRGVVVKDEGDHIASQDSCGSNKQTDYMKSKPREVESQRLYEGSYEMENVDGVDIYSSESSSSSHGQHLVFDKNGVCDVRHDRVITPLLPQVVTSYGYKPSGYLKVKVKGVGENAGITAVKRLLGRHYREDGPPLAVDFDPLPPEAFESPTKDIVQDCERVFSLKSGYHTKPSDLVPLDGCRSPYSMKRGLSSRTAEKYCEEKNHVKMHREKLHSNHR